MDSVSTLGFRVWQGRPGQMGDAHMHGDVEVNRVCSGRIRYFAGGVFHELLPGHFTAFWAGIPHQTLSVEPGTVAQWITIPLSWAMQWELGERFTKALLAGRFLAESQSDPMDDLLFARWSADLKTDSPRRHRIVMLEVEARLRRMALHVRHAKRPIVAKPAAGGQVQRIAGYIGEHYRQSLAVAQIAGAVGLHPNYAMNVFRRHAGMSIGDYLTRLRVSHAQALLIRTDWTMLRVADAAGFGSASRFYAAFSRIAKTTPTAYRSKHRGRARKSNL